MSLTSSNHSKARICWSKAEPPNQTNGISNSKAFAKHTSLVSSRGFWANPPTASLIFRYIVCRGWTPIISLTHQQPGYFAFNDRIFSSLYYLVKKDSRYTIKNACFSLKIPYYPLMFNLYWDLRMPLYWDK